MRTLFVTCTGSHMWRMNTVESNLCKNTYCSVAGMADEEAFREFLFRLRMDEMAGKIDFGEGPRRLKEKAPHNCTA